MDQHRLYVGNIGHSTTEPELREAFAIFGQVDLVSIMTERHSGRPRGFAFVAMGSDAEAQAAILGMNGRDLGGLTLKVGVAKALMPRIGDRDSQRRQIW